MELSFSANRLETMNPRDFMLAMADVIKDHSDKAYISFTDHFYESDSSSALMETVVVKFQVWKEGESGNGTTLYWSSYQAKDRACSNRMIQTFPPIPRGPVMLSPLGGEEIKKLLKQKL